MEKFSTKCSRVLKGHQGPIYAVRFNVKGTYCMTCGQDRTVRLWNPHRLNPENEESALQIKSYSGRHGYDILDVAISHDNASFCSGGSDKIIFLWDVATGRVIRKFTGHEQRINAVKYNNDGSVLLSTSYDKTLRIWDIRARNSYEPIQILDQFKDSVTSVVVSGHEIIASSVDGCIRVFDLRAGEIHIDNLHHPVTSVELSNDSNCILSSCLDSCVRLTEKSTGSLLSEYRGHRNESFAINSVFSNTDEYIWSGSEDGKIYVWDLVEEKVVHSYQAHQKAVSCLAFHPEESLCVSVSYDGVGKVWEC